MRISNFLLWNLAYTELYFLAAAVARLRRRRASTRRSISCRSRAAFRAHGGRGRGRGRQPVIRPAARARVSTRRCAGGDDVHARSGWLAPVPLRAERARRHCGRPDRGHARGSVCADRRRSGMLALALVILGGAWEWAGFFGADSAIADPCGLRGGHRGGDGRVLVEHRAGSGPVPVPALGRGALVGGRARLAGPLSDPDPLALNVLCGGLVLVPAWLALARLLDGRRGPEWLLFVFVLVWAADIGAFFVGRAVGRVRLAVRVRSPARPGRAALGGALPTAGDCGEFAGRCLTGSDLPVTGFGLSGSAWRPRWSRSSATSR